MHIPAALHLIGDRHGTVATVSVPPVRIVHLPSIAGLLQRRQVSMHELSQQRPSVQNPERHSKPLPQDAPIASFGMHAAPKKQCSVGMQAVMQQIPLTHAPLAHSRLPAQVEPLVFFTRQAVISQ